MTNWLGHKARWGLAKVAFSRMVAVFWLIWLSMTSSSPLPSLVLPSRLKASTVKVPSSICWPTCGK